MRIWLLRKFAKKAGLLPLLKGILLLVFKLIGAPRILAFSSELNKVILTAFGANIGNNVHVFSPLILHHPRRGKTSKL